MTPDLAGIIDVGSASVRFSVFAYQPSLGLQLTFDKGQITNLGDGLNSRTQWQEACKRTIRAVKQILLEMPGDPPLQGVCLGTHALRASPFKLDLVNLLHQATGYQVEILEEITEGMLAWKGSEDLLDADDLLIDLGGGSTEFILRDPENNLSVFSYPIGAGNHLMTQGKFPFGLNAIHDLLEIAAEKISRIKIDMKKFKFSKAVVLGGTITTASAIYSGISHYKTGCVHGKTIRISDLEEILTSILGKDKKEWTNIPGMEQGRSHLMINGLPLLIAISRLFELDQLTISERGIRFGRASMYFSNPKRSDMLI